MRQSFDWPPNKTVQCSVLFTTVDAKSMAAAVCGTWVKCCLYPSASVCTQAVHTYDFVWWHCLALETVDSTACYYFVLTLRRDKGPPMKITETAAALASIKPLPGAWATPANHSRCAAWESTCKRIINGRGRQEKHRARMCDLKPWIQVIWDGNIHMLW